MNKITPTRKISLGIRQAFIRRSDLSIGARFLYILLMTYKGSDFACFPSDRRLALDCGVDHRTIKRWVKELKKNGFITTKRRGFNKSISYHLDGYHKLNSQQPTTQIDPKSAGLVSPDTSNDEPGAGLVSPAVRVWCPPTHIPIDLKKKEIKKENDENSFKKDQLPKGKTITQTPGFIKLRKVADATRSKK